MTESDITKYITETFADVDVVNHPKYTFFFTDPQHRIGFATLATADEEGDQLSQLDREGVFRLNIGFDPGVAPTEDYAQLDKLIPHPVYHAWGWVAVLNPSDATFEELKPLLAEAYALSRRRYNG